MAFSTLLIAFATIASSFVSITASPVGAVSLKTDMLVKRQDDVPDCSYVFRPQTNPGLLDVNLPVNFRQVLTQLYTESNPGGVGVDTSDNWFEVASNGDGTWSWTSWIPLYDPVTNEFWTGQAISDATEGLVGLSTTTPVTTWTVESAGCNPLRLGKTSTSSRSIGHEVREAGTTQLAKRQETAVPECAFTFRADNDAALVGVELEEETWRVWLASAFGKYGRDATGEVTGVGSSYPSLLSHNSDGTWFWTARVSLYGLSDEQLSAQEVVDKADGLVGFHSTTTSTGWVIEAVTCVITT